MTFSVSIFNELMRDYCALAEETMGTMFCEKPYNRTALENRINIKWLKREMIDAKKRERVVRPLP